MDDDEDIRWTNYLAALKALAAKEAGLVNCGAPPETSETSEAPAEPNRVPRIVSILRSGAAGDTKAA